MRSGSKLDDEVKDAEGQDERDGTRPEEDAVGCQAEHVANQPERHAGHQHAGHVEEIVGGDQMPLFVVVGTGLQERVQRHEEQAAEKAGGTDGRGKTRVAGGTGACHQ